MKPMTAIHRATHAALLAAALGAVPLAAALAQTAGPSMETVADTDDSLAAGVPQQDLQQLNLDRLQLTQAIQQLRQDTAAGDQSSVLLDQQAVAQDRLALIEQQLASDRDRPTQQMPATAQAALQVRDQYLAAEQIVATAELRLAVDRQSGNGGAVQVDTLELQQARAQALQARQKWIAVRAPLAGGVAPSSSANGAPPSVAAPPPAGAPIPQAVQAPQPAQSSLRPQPAAVPAAVAH